MKMLMIVHVLRRLFADTRGASVVEYGLVLAMIALLTLVGLSQFGVSLQALAQQIADQLGTASR